MFSVTNKPPKSRRVTVGLLLVRSVTRSEKPALSWIRFTPVLLVTRLHGWYGCHDHDGAEIATWAVHEFTLHAAYQAGTGSPSVDCRSVGWYHGTVCNAIIGCSDQRCCTATSRRYFTIAVSFSLTLRCCLVKQYTASTFSHLASFLLSVTI